MGWITITGTAVAGLSAALKFMESQGICQGCGSVADAIGTLATGIIGLGLRRKLAEK